MRDCDSVFCKLEKAKVRINTFQNAASYIHLYPVVSHIIVTYTEAQQQQSEGSQYT